jgi:hypothetical protein
MFIEVVEPQLPSPQSIAQLMQKSIAEANEGITHAEFAAGAQGGTIGFKCMVGAPQQFITSRVLKAIFGIFVLLYSLAPLILVPIWAYHERNAWLLVGIPVSYIASYSAAVNSKLVFLFLMLCVGVWLWTASVFISTSPSFSSVRCGDTYFTSSQGRIIGCVLMTAGAGLFATLTGLIASMFLQSRKSESELKQLAQEVRTLARKIETINSSSSNRSESAPATRDMEK